MLIKLEITVSTAVSVIENLSREDLHGERSVQGFQFSGIGSIIHVVEHFSYHTGQIAVLTKLMVDQDLGFYSGLDLNVKNQ